MESQEARRSNICRRPGGLPVCLPLELFLNVLLVITHTHTHTGSVYGGVGGCLRAPSPSLLEGEGEAWY